MHLRRPAVLSTLALCLVAVAFQGGAARAAAPSKVAPSRFATPIALESLDPAAFAHWVDGKESPMPQKDGPRHVIWTSNSALEWDGVAYGNSKKPGMRHLRIGFKSAETVAAVLVRAGGRLSVLKPGVAYPGNLADETQWIAADRLVKQAVSRTEPDRESYALWVLSPAVATRALRFSHEAKGSDTSYEGWLGGAYVLGERFANVAPQAVASTEARGEAAERINNENNDGLWGAWDNGPQGGAEMVSASHPVDVVLTWPQPVKVEGLAAVWAGFSTAEVDSYEGPADRPPREAVESDWRVVKQFSGIENQYPRSLGVNWLDFGKTITTRALRIRITGVTTEGHPHLQGKTNAGRRVWLGELLALDPLGDAALEKAVLRTSEIAASHPPIPIRFTLKRPGYVTLAIDDAQGIRVRNLVSETFFPAGDNVAWWDGLDDTRRDIDAARHGVYHIPGQLVAPGTYQASGLWHSGVDLRYEFSVYCPGTPPWPTADHSGGWLTNHTPPHGTLFVPGDRAPGGKPLVYIGSYVAEGGDGLAWVDLEGHKQGGVGWVGGAWTGAPYLALDASPQAPPAVCCYTGSAWEGELRLTAMTKDGEKPVLKQHFEGGKDVLALTGLAAHNGLLVCSLPKQKKLLFADSAKGKVVGEWPMDDPRGVAFDAEGRLLVLSGKSLRRFTVSSVGTPKLQGEETVVTQGLEDPQHVTLDRRGNLYVSDRGASHQVKVFDPTGKSLRTIGVRGVPVAGRYDPLHMNNPNGLTIDSNDHLWVAETDFQPKRVSTWTLDGKLVKAFYGPSQYGGGGALDPQDKSRFYYYGMEFKLDWQKGRDELVRVFHRPGPTDLQMPKGFGLDGLPETAIYITRNGKSQRYFTNCYNSNPTNGAGFTALWIDRGDVVVPVAAFGQPNQWDVLKGDVFKARLPKGIDLKGDFWQNQVLFSWADLNGDGQVQPAEVTFTKASVGGLTVMSDLAIVASRIDERTVRFPVIRWTDHGVPVYDLAAGETLLKGAQSPTSSGGDQALTHPNGWTIATIAPAPFAPQSVGGALRGQPRWSYPNLWPGLHASHESPAPDRPGQLIGTTRLLGGLVTPPAGEAGPLWCVNGNQGNMYLFTMDGLFVAEFFHDIRRAPNWAMPGFERGMSVKNLSLHDENFWPSISQTPDGQVYLVEGARGALVRVEGLESVCRLPKQALRLSAGDLQKAQEFVLRAESQRQKELGRPTLKVRISQTTPKVDGKLDDWPKEDWAAIDRSGVAAFFDANTKPYDVAASLRIVGDRLYVAFRTTDAELLKNSGEVANAPFKTGGCLDVMIGTAPAAADRREAPVQGDLRLLVTLVKEKPLALVYRPVVPGTKEPVPFSSPWRTITIDRVDDVSDQVQLAGAEGNYEFSIPLSALAWKPAEGQKISGDVGILRGNGFQTVHRLYWSNKATAITSDVPSEAMLTPNLWGVWRIEKTP